MIAVTGATGQLGQLVIKSLLKKVPASTIVAIARNPEKAKDIRDLGVEVRQADYDRPHTLAPALVGVNKLLLISSSAVGQRVAHHKAVINEAVRAGVNLLAYTSVLKADESPMALAQEHKITEKMIKASGLPAVILRNGWYTENYTQSIGAVLESGIVAGAAEQGRFNTAPRQDYAEAAAVVLTNNDNHVGKIYELAGDQGFTLNEFAQAIAKQSGKTIRYENLKATDFAEFLMTIGLPQGFADALADSEVQAARGWLASEDRTLRRLIGRSTTPLETMISDAVAV